MAIPNHELKSKVFHGGGMSRKLWTPYNEIVVPKSMQDKIIQWYHTVLLHPGHDRSERTISQHFWWPKLREHIRLHVKACPECQHNKCRQAKYGLLSPMVAEATPWDKQCVDLIGPYTIRHKGKENLVCKAVTMIDPATGWFEVQEIPDARSDTVANVIDQEWFHRFMKILRISKIDQILSKPNHFP